MSISAKILILFLLSALIGSCRDVRSNDLEFYPDEWKKADFRARGRMYGNLFEQRLLHGRTREEVLDLLGKPDEEYEHSVKYAIDLGSIFERWLNRNFIMITFDERTQKVKHFGLADS